MRSSAQTGETKNHEEASTRDHGTARQQLEQELRPTKKRADLESGQQLWRPSPGVAVSPQSKAKGKPGNDGPASSRCIYPRPPLRDFTTIDGLQKQNPPTEVGGFAAVYFGASPVASALDLRLGRDPSADPFHSNRPSSSAWSKPDISTLQRIGHFYFALTRPGRLQSSSVELARLDIILINHVVKAA